MLTKIREKIQGIIATIILIFLAIPFILWGIGSYFEGAADPAVAEVNGIEITQQTFYQRLERIRQMNPQAAVETRGLKELVLDGMIDETLVLEHARDQGYRASNAQLLRVIQGLPYFQRDGRFDPALYDALLRQQGMRPSEFEAQLRNELVAAQVQRGLSESAFVTDAELAAALKLLRQERRVSYALIRPEAFLPAIAIGAQEIEDYYRAHTDRFRTEESVQVEYVALRAADLARQIEPTEEELRQAYAAESARYVTPERRRASHILIEVPAGADAAAAEAARAKAEDLLKQLRSGADFAALAKQHSNDVASAAKGGDLGNVGRGVLPAELEKAVYALAPGGISDVVRTEYGFHIAKLTEYEPEKRRSFESVKEELRDMVRTRKGEERFFEMGERLRNLVYEHPDTLEVAARELGLKVERSGWFTRAGGEGIAAQRKVVEAAFEPEVLSRERNSDAIEADQQTLVAVRVIDHRPSVVRPLEEVRGEIERMLKEQRAREQARATAQEWAQAVAGGKRLAELARGRAGVTVETKTITREKPDGVDARLADALFAAAKPDGKAVVGHVDLGANGAAVYVLEAVKDGDPASADESLKTRVRQQLLARRGADYYLSHRRGLRQSADVDINAELL
ncbi:MAG TPA: SurA N-terminal domain-containing protein [Burkholderiales bacterium]